MSARPDIARRVGVVAIGRNEGERLHRCLQSAGVHATHIIYVDSGSSDSSVEMAASLGVEVVRLDMGRPFTAARARNAGIARLCEVASSDIEFVQVVDGDCELVDGWMNAALDALDGNPRLAVACGRRRERFPDESIYNRLCDMEWNTPVGEARSCGGDSMIRLAALQQIGGYDDSLIAGEEPEMCLRLRRAGWTIARLDREMTLHDAQMTRFGQWWKRMVRSGHAYAEGAALHGSSAERYRVREVRSILFWALLLPAAAVVLAPFTYGASLAALILGYVILWLRVRGHRLSHGDSTRFASMYAAYLVIGKFAQCCGLLQFWFNRMRGRRTALIEYKGAASDSAGSARRPPETSHAG
jgi:GT2 family glycosyltransferase